MTEYEADIIPIHSFPSPGRFFTAQNDGDSMTDEDKFLHAVEFVLANEGGYVNDPNDPGGETKYGITKRSYPHLDIRNLTKEQAIAIYKRDWWDRYSYGRINNLDVATKVFDMAVHMGPYTAHRILQEALVWIGHSVKLDGIIGPETIKATNEANPERLLEALRYLSAMHFYQLVRANRKLEKYLVGWLNRAYS